MTNREIAALFSQLSTPLVTDACLRLDIPVGIVPHGITPLIPGRRSAGHVIPARHYGSVDVFLEAMLDANEGDVLVVGNEGREDEACVGDLTVLEARASGTVAVIVFGLHRDTPELVEIGFPVYSYGSFPAGPRRLDEREEEALVSVHFGDATVTKDDVVFADDDGVAFVPANRTAEVLETAGTIWETERIQADRVRSGHSLREQLRFDEFLAARDRDSSVTFRTHLRNIKGAIEE